jgi:hypothetical protein
LLTKLTFTDYHPALFWGEGNTASQTLVGTRGRVRRAFLSTTSDLYPEPL